MKLSKHQEKCAELRRRAIQMHKDGATTSTIVRGLTEVHCTENILAEAGEARYKEELTLDALSVSERSVRRWIANFKKYGGEGIKARPIPGRPRKLDVKALKQLDQMLQEGPGKAGYTKKYWTGRLVATLVKRTFGRPYSLTHVPRLLRSLGWERQEVPATTKRRKSRFVWKKASNP